MPNKGMVEMDSLDMERKVEVARMALIGRYLFERLKDEEKERVIDVANRRLRTMGYPRFIDEFEDKIQWFFWALSLEELGFDHGLKSFKWISVKDPFTVATFEDAHWKAAGKMLRKKNGIDIVCLS